MATETSQIPDRRSNGTTNSETGIGNGPVRGHAPGIVTIGRTREDPGPGTNPATRLMVITVRRRTEMAPPGVLPMMVENRRPVAGGSTTCTRRSSHEKMVIGGVERDWAGGRRIEEEEEEEPEAVA